MQDAGYEDAIENSKEWGVKIPMLKNSIILFKMNSLKLGNIGSLVSFNSEYSKMITEREVEVVIENGKLLTLGKN